MAKSLLTKNQVNFLKIVGSDPYLTKYFYLTGGTALSEFYLKHRFSEDLDFFSEQEFSPINITPFIKKSKDLLNFTKFDYNSIQENLAL